MTEEEFALYHHETRLELELFRRSGASFQYFFEQIMQKKDPSFLMVKPMGREGDWKTDGYSLNSKTIYQCYAPEEMAAAKAAKKIHEDFDGAKIKWQDKMRCWIFVWSSDRALPPQVVAALADLRSSNSGMVIDHIGRAGLWDIVKNLSAADRVALLGVVPDRRQVPITTAAEIQVLMKHLGAHTALVSDPSDLNLTAIAEKLQRNRLSAAVIATVKPATPVAKLVRDFVTSMPDPAFSQAIAFDLAERYTTVAASMDDPNAIFSDLIDYVLGERRPDLKFFWAAAGIVTYYFELCDIFER